MMQSSLNSHFQKVVMAILVEEVKVKGTKNGKKKKQSLLFRMTRDSL